MSFSVLIAGSDTECVDQKPTKKCERWQRKGKCDKKWAKRKCKKTCGECKITYTHFITFTTPVPLKINQNVFCNGKLLYDLLKHQ